MWHSRQRTTAGNQRLEVRCRDSSGKNQTLILHCEDGEIALTTPAGERLLLAPLQAGRLRAALRDLVINANPQ